MSSKVAKFVALAVIGVGLFVCNSLWMNANAPVIGADLAVSAVNGGNEAWQTSHVFERHKNIVNTICVALFLVATLVLFRPRNKEVVQGKGAGALILVLLAAMSTTGCVKKYDTPEYGEIKTSETGFVIKLEGENVEGQAKFNSAAYLEERKIGSKRIQITHRWNQTGRRSWQGEWIPTVRLIIVDRSPVTREWQSQDGTEKGKDQAIWIESADSVGFSMGWSCTAFIQEEDAAQFLYMYPSGSLATVMDAEIRARIQEVAAMGAAKYKLDELRDKKAEIATAVKTDITEFFKGRGITITTIGMFGGMTYENAKIQEAIDATFITQQEKVNSKSMLDAQADKNSRIKSEAEAVADAARMKAKGEADGNLSKAEAEAKGIEAVNTAIAKANNNPMLIQLKSLEVERARVAAWNGAYPAQVVGSGANTWVGLSAPSAAVTTQVVTNGVSNGDSTRQITLSVFRDE